MPSPLILVTGATGYIASRLIPRLLEKGYRVRVLARHPERLAGRTWLPQVEVKAGDVTHITSLDAALSGVQTAYYFIHSMSSGRGYARIELNGANNFASAAERAGVQHIIYLGGLADPQDKHITPHLRSRIRTGEVLREGRVPVTEFRAGVIAGSGSISFEMIRFMTELFPVVPGPTWLKNKSQPIAVQNVIDYLLAALEDPIGQDRILELGGPDIMAYGELMVSYARMRRLKRAFVMLRGIPVWFMAIGAGLMTPVPRPIAQALIGGLACDSVVRHDEARRVYPKIQLVGFEQATADALARLSPGHLERVWEGLGHNAINLKHEGFFIDCRRIAVSASTTSVYRIFTSMSKERGWLYANGLWTLRGWLDKLIGGPGLRGRPESLREGGIVDYYRVESLEPDRLLRLYSELRAPGEGWMEWRVEPRENGSLLTQTAFFAPRGLPGFLYWYLLNPFHRLVCRGLIHTIAERSEPWKTQ